MKPYQLLMKPYQLCLVDIIYYLSPVLMKPISFKVYSNSRGLQTSSGTSIKMLGKLSVPFTDPENI